MVTLSSMPSPPPATIPPTPFLRARLTSGPFSWERLAASSVRHLLSPIFEPLLIYKPTSQLVRSTTRTAANSASPSRRTVSRVSPSDETLRPPTSVPPACPPAISPTLHPSPEAKPSRGNVWTRRTTSRPVEAASSRSWVKPKVRIVPSLKVLMR